jgi:DNA-binding PadR family transcriptional regulator
MTVKHSLLGLLAESPGTGYALKQRYEDRTGAMWPVNIGQVYKTLARLDSDGLVARAGGDETALFELTDAGRAELSEWLAEPVPVTGLRDELVVKVLLALGTPGVDGSKIVQQHRRAVTDELQRVTRTRSDDDLIWALLVDSLVLRLDAVLRWLDRCEARLQKRAGRRT